MPKVIWTPNDIISASGALQFALIATILNTRECEFCLEIRSQNASRHLDSRGASWTRSLRVFWQSNLATCESVCFVVVSCLWANARAKRGNGAKRSDLAHGKLTDALVTEEQHPGSAQPKGFRWFSGPEDVLRVVLRVVLGSETWAWGGRSVVLRCIHHCML
jgi:hypothetical protein